MNRRLSLLVLALGVLLSFGHTASAQQLKVLLKEANNDEANGVPCIAEMSAMDKKATFKAGDPVSWLIDGTDCMKYKASKMRVRFGQKSKLIVGGNNALKNCVVKSMYTCEISATITSDTMTGAPHMSKHPYGVTMNGDDTGDPEIDIDNGSGAPPPPGARRGGGPPAPPPGPGRSGNGGSGGRGASGR